MTLKKSKSKKSKSIARGRPPLVKEHSRSLSSKATRTLIHSHHNLKKAQIRALKDNDDAEAERLEAEIVATGGLTKYQSASRQGQAAERGGDSSRVLVEWLQPAFDEVKCRGERFRLLEIGALSTKNACSGVACLDVKRIDLKSREQGIEEVDFMDMATPEDGKKYHIISLSLVLNYVPDPASRGAMIARLPNFLEKSKGESMIPTLFLVLPLACVANSRYLTEERLSQIMRAAGFQSSKQKTTSKLYYSLWIFNAVSTSLDHCDFKKEELRSGASRNNFAIIMSNKDSK